ncbi:MAG TPA: oligosaccharide flippase family protein, partial [Rhodanobacteraceae bacterium]
MNHAFGRTAALKAVIWTTGSTYIGYILGLLINILIARRLDAADFGRYAYLVWLSGVLVLIANNGLTTTGIKFVSETLGRNARDEAASVYGWLRRIQPVCIGLVAIACLVAMPFVMPAGWEGRLTGFAAAVIVAFVFKAWAMLNSSIAKGYGQFTNEPITSTIALIFNAVVAGILALLNAPMEAYAILFAATSVAYALISQFLLRKVGIHPEHGGLSETTKARIRRHLFWTATLAAISAIGTRSIETFLLNHWVGAAEVGFFAISTNLTRAGIDLLVAGLSSVMMPILGYVIGTG